MNLVAFQAMQLYTVASYCKEVWALTVVLPIICLDFSLPINSYLNCFAIALCLLLCMQWHRSKIGNGKAKFMTNSWPFCEENWMVSNQAHTGLWLVCAWLLKIIFVQKSVSVHVCMCVCVCVCPPPRLLITSGMMWRDMDTIRLVKQVLKLLYGNCNRFR